MAPRQAPDIDPSERLDTAISAAEEASERFTQAKTELLHRLADIDGAVIEIVQRVFDATPPEYQRTFLVRIDGDDEELTLPDFLRLLIERPDGTSAEFTISVPENLYDDEGDESDADEELDADEPDEEAEDEADDAGPEDEGEAEPEEEPPPPAPARSRGKARRPASIEEEDEELGF